jgi:hypothetical protein
MPFRQPQAWQRPSSGDGTAQVGVWATCVTAVGRMARAGWPGFASGGALWFPDLRQPYCVRHTLDAPPAAASARSGAGAGGAGASEQGPEGWGQGRSWEGAAAPEGAGEGLEGGVAPLDMMLDQATLLVYEYPMGPQGLLLPAAVCAAMALQIHWAAPARQALGQAAAGARAVSCVPGRAPPAHARECHRRWNVCVCQEAAVTPRSECARMPARSSPTRLEICPAADFRIGKAGAAARS